MGRSLRAELKALFGRGIEGSDEKWNSLIAEADTNGDGQISLKEFTALLLQLQ